MLRYFVMMAFVFLGASGIEAEVTGVDGQAVAVENPQRIVTINGTLAEILYELGEGHRLVGTDNSALYPPAAEELPKLGHPYRIGVEGVISLMPDLVIGTEDNLPAATARQIRSAGVSVLVLSASDKGGVEAMKERIRIIAGALNVSEAGDEVIGRIDRELAALAERVERQAASGTSPPSVLFLYAHGGGTAYAYGKETGTETLIELAGASNAAAFATGRTAFTAEAIARAAPDAIVMLQRSLDAVGGVEGVLRIPGVSLTPAGRERRIIAVDNSVRWVGPRFPQLAAELARQLQQSE